ncbi:MAG TPA: ATP-grasp fold amidoligase family protein [Sphingobacterium sp.]|nr:ATP-grasp fold amidoligase family protein [Sphingobacterium sp.]
MGQVPDLDSPTLFTEKMQWIKLHYNHPLYIKCADKYAVRAYVESKGYKHILNDLIGVYTSAEDIPLDELPDKFVLKATHGCTWNYLCRDKSEEIAQWEETKLLLNEWLAQDYAVHGRELHYTYIPPRLICERFLENADGSQIRDYKIHCFHGEPKLIQVDYERFTEHQRNYYDPDWNLTDIKWVEQDNYPEVEDKPTNLEEMLAVARALSADFGYVRVDLYNVEGKVVFGELTFTPGCGFTKLEPEEMDMIMGDWLTLPLESKYVVK